MDNQLLMRYIGKGIDDKLEEFIKEVECPECKKFVTAIRAGYISKDEEDEYGDDVWRCMLCLNLIKQMWQVVKPNK